MTQLISSINQYKSKELQKRCANDKTRLNFSRGFNDFSIMRILKMKRLLLYFVVPSILFFMTIQILTDFSHGFTSSSPRFRVSTSSNQPLIIVITPTYKRLARIADMLRMANTLTHIADLHWIVIEDGPSRRRPVEKILNRTGLPYTYLPYKTVAGYPKRGWYQRTMALTYLRNNTKEILGNHKEGVVYFGDDDNSYDIRLFNDYIRHVRVLGMWAVGFVGSTYVEAPHVINGSVVSYDVRWNPKRKFAVDMAGFAVNLDVVLKTDAVFGKSCKRGGGAPETCLLEDMHLTMKDIEPFGFDQTEKEIYVWHTKTSQPSLAKKKPNSTAVFKPLQTFGFEIET